MVTARPASILAAEASVTTTIITMAITITAVTMVVVIMVAATITTDGRVRMAAMLRQIGGTLWSKGLLAVPTGRWRNSHAGAMQRFISPVQVRG